MAHVFASFVYIVSADDSEIRRTENRLAERHAHPRLPFPWGLLSQSVEKRVHRERYCARAHTHTHTHRQTEEGDALWRWNISTVLTDDGKWRWLDGGTDVREDGDTRRNKIIRCMKEEDVETDIKS